MFNTLGRVAADHHLPLVLTALGLCACSGMIAGRLYAQGRRESRFFRNLWIGATGMLAGTGAWSAHLLGLMAYSPAFGAHYHAVYAACAWLTAMAGGVAAVAFSIRQRDAGARLASGAALGVSLCGMQVLGFASLEPLGRVEWHGEAMSLWGGLGIGLSMLAVWAIGRGDRWPWRTLFAVALTGSVAAIQCGGLTAMQVIAGPVQAAGELAVATPILATIAIFLLITTAAVSVGAVAISARSQVQALGDLREAINAMPAGLAFYDSEDRCIIWNSAYASHARDVGPLVRTGVNFRDLVKAQLAMGALPIEKEQQSEYIEQRMRKRRDSAGPSEQQHCGQWLRVEDRRTASGGTVSIVHDITDLKAAAAALESARDEAQAANRAKSEFLANMSHELRTPLNGVIGVADALARTRMTVRQREMLRTVQQSALTLQGVLADLLDVARIESGRLQLTVERFALGSVLRDAASLWRLEAEKKGVRFDLTVSPDAEADVEGDQVRLRQVVVNLLSNAVKFTGQGEVSLQAERRSDAPQQVVIRVRDSGIGFKPEVSERLFGRFEQADGSVTRRFGGTGLGLSISRDLVERMGGRIWATGELEQGAVFHVELPLPPLARDEADAASGEAPTTEQERRPLRVLCAEDHAVNRKVVEFILADAGVDLVFAMDGEEALESFRTGQFDAILMDMQMPVVDGLSATRAIREIEGDTGQERTPIIMVTANALPEHVQSSHAAGADLHLTKPISAEQLLRTLDAAVSQTFGAGELAAIAA